MNRLIKTQNYDEKFNSDVQRFLLRFVLTDIEIYKSTRPALNSDYFDAKLVRAVNLINQHFDDTGALPDPKWLNVKTGIMFERLILKNGDREAYTAELDEFARYKALQNAIIDSAKLLEEGKFVQAQNGIIDAGKVSITARERPFRTMLASQTSLLKPPSYLIRPWLMKDTVTAVYGPSRSFKSFWCLHAALCVATGSPFDGYPVKKSPVWYIASEGEVGVGMRIEAWKQANPSACLADEDMIIITQPIKLLDENEVGKLISMIKNEEASRGTQCEILFVDTLSQCIAGGKENEAEVASLAVEQMIRVRREVGATVVFVHHTGKDVARGMRGSYAYFSNSDAVLEIIRQEDGMTAKATVLKMKDGPDGQEMGFGVRVQKIPAFASAEIDASLVLDFDLDDIVTEDKQDKKELTKKKKILQYRMAVFHAFDSVGQQLSLAEVCRKIGWHDNKTYKDRIVKAFPLLASVEVVDQDNNLLGKLIRNPSNGTSFGELTRTE